MRIFEIDLKLHLKLIKENYVDNLFLLFFISDATDVFLLSGSDGRPLLAKMARELARSSSPSSEVDQAGVELMMDRLHPKEPELLLQFSGSRILSNSTMGFPPWHLRLTQMM